MRRLRWLRSPAHRSRPASMPMASRSWTACASARRCTTSISTRPTNGRAAWTCRCSNGRPSPASPCPMTPSPSRIRWPAARPPWASRPCRTWRACWSMRWPICSRSAAARLSRSPPALRPPTRCSACCTSSRPASSRHPSRAWKKPCRHCWRWISKSRTLRTAGSMRCCRSRCRSLARMPCSTPAPMRRPRHRTWRRWLFHAPPGQRRTPGSRAAAPHR